MSLLSSLCLRSRNSKRTAFSAHAHNYALASDLTASAAVSVVYESTEPFTMLGKDENESHFVTGLEMCAPLQYLVYTSLIYQISYAPFLRCVFRSIVHHTRHAPAAGVEMQGIL